MPAYSGTGSSSKSIRGPGPVKHTARKARRGLRTAVTVTSTGHIKAPPSAAPSTVKAARSAKHYLATAGGSAARHQAAAVAHRRHRSPQAQVRRQLKRQVLSKLRRAATSGFRGNSVVDKSGRILVKHGFTPVAAAGIIGNALQESSWNPGSVGSGGGGLWGFTAHPNSLSDLQAFAASKGKPWNKAGIQTRFLLKHISPETKAAVNAARTPEQAAAAFMSGFERPYAPTANLPRRQQGARIAYEQIKQAELPKHLVKRAEKLVGKAKVRKVIRKARGEPPVKLHTAELFYDPGINLKNGQPTSPIGGHSDHVHFASANPRDVLRAAKIAHSMGATVSENPAFGGVEPVHTSGSYHYRSERLPRKLKPLERKAGGSGRTIGEAIDIQGSPSVLMKVDKKLAALTGAYTSGYSGGTYAGAGAVTTSAPGGAPAAPSPPGSSPAQSKSARNKRNKRNSQAARIKAQIRAEVLQGSTDQVAPTAPTPKYKMRYEPPSRAVNLGL